MTPESSKQYHDPAIERHPVAIVPSESTIPKCPSLSIRIASMYSNGRI